MSWTTTFQLDYATITASATSTSATGAQLQSTDAVLTFATGPAIGKSATVGSISAAAIATSVTTPAGAASTTITPFGYSFLTSLTTAGLSFLPGAAAAGRYLTITLSGTCTTTGYLVICQSTNVVVFSTGSSSSTVKPWQTIAFGQPGAYVDLISQSTGIWQVLGASLSPSIAFTTTTSS